MSEFTNVTVIKKSNVYFDGKVVSRTVVFADGSKKTLGIMQPGEYEFGTGDKELMEIISGELDVALPGAASARPVKAGESFEVPANSKFRMVVKTLTDYCCTFIAS
ncbi:MAG: pyrimidine/purine nucleoside phosphorylase [Candidatus Binatia bacterium]